MKRLIVLIFCLLISQLGSAKTVRLITIGPGDAFWSAFGHSALSIDDVVYGFGYFSFDDDIIQSFVTNQMRYDLGVSEFNHELFLASQQNRNFSVIELQLDDDEVQAIDAYLKWHYQPENQTYAYDYFLNNCSTKIRDLLDLIWSGDLKKTNGLKSESNYFEQTFPAKNQGLMNFGLAIAYGWHAYTTRTDWELMALPVYFEAQVSRSMSAHILPRQLIYPAVDDAWLVSLFLTHWMLILYVLLWSLFLVLPLTQVLAAKLWFGLHGIIGLVLLAFWLLTPHQMIDLNFNVLLFNPFGLMLGRFKSIYKILLMGWILWLLMAVYLQAWYLMALLIPAVMALKVIRKSS